jgi:hypothetical protein
MSPSSIYKNTLLKLFSFRLFLKFLMASSDMSQPMTLETYSLDSSSLARRARRLHEKSSTQKL